MTTGLSGSYRKNPAIVKIEKADCDRQPVRNASAVFLTGRGIAHAKRRLTQNDKAHHAHIADIVGQMGVVGCTLRR